MRKKKLMVIFRGINVDYFDPTTKIEVDEKKLLLQKSRGEKLEIRRQNFEERLETKKTEKTVEEGRCCLNRFRRARTPPWRRDCSL